MDSPHIVKVDSKGRVLIPVDIRSGMGIEEGTRIIVVPDGDNGHFKMTPIVKNKTAEVKVMLRELSSMASVADALSANSFNVIISESRMLDKKLTEWKILVDMSERNNGVETLKDIISHVDGVKSLDVSVK
ncbi:MAG: AbrB/MazE/SpoVT family DNA-binding domain-containing protein [Candidatus Aenigmarchaeota archaeon]|nr:AbrB/MazE/SpoVT family DNA-binding domain-containing protein [Candidatus Aenigmarchaeota archaeon]